MGLIKEFRDFAVKGNVVDMAVGIIIGAAFTSVVNSLVKDVIMPPIGLFTGGLDFSDKKVVLQEAVTEAQVEAGSAAAVLPEVAIGYGSFINALISFLIVAFAVFVLVKMVNQAKRLAVAEEEAKPAAPPADVQLLTEIRDLLKTER